LSRPSESSLASLQCTSDDDDDDDDDDEYEVHVAPSIHRAISSPSAPGRAVHVSLPVPSSHLSSESDVEEGEERERSESGESGQESENESEHEESDHDSEHDECGAGISDSSYNVTAGSGDDEEGAKESPTNQTLAAGPIPSMHQTTLQAMTASDTFEESANDESAIDESDPSEDFDSLSSFSNEV
jgi:hypothetical protein